ncbi:MAG: ADP-ribosylglycohydrolase family protein [Hyphomonadaceae bacterium]|nr:ADP-ribosylglycohydrolase family protein [Hyphomonadaceae bacterium]
MERTSLTHPLQIDELACARGVLGLTFCPGKCGPSVFGRAWARDLGLDVAAIARWGASTVVTLMETAELKTLGVSGIRAMTEAAGMRWLHLPIADLGAPGAAFQRAWQEVGPTIRAELESGGSVLVHCRGGRGRTGLVAAQLLVEFGDQPEDAIAKVRSVRDGAIETAIQAEYVRGLRPPDTHRHHLPLSRQDRLRGVLLGGALGDALGAPVEFMTRQAILARFGPRGITDFAPAYGRLGAITDDTQMTMFTLEGLIRAEMRFEGKGICNPIAVIDRAYLRWYATQGPRPPGSFAIDGWLYQLPALNSPRAPDVTCLGALAAKQWRPGDPAANDSKGAGGIMRVAPIGAVMDKSPFELARDAAALTHGHVTGHVAAGWFAAFIFEICQGASISAAARSAMVACRGQAPELDQALREAIKAAGAGPSDQVPPSLGEGWIAEEAAAISLWCVLTCEDPFEAVRLAINIDGDSDTTGTLVGQIMGAAYGDGWIPQHLLARLELRAELETLANDAAWLFWGGENEAGETWSGSYSPSNASTDRFWDRYPGW